jgi:cephalosporin hydroxylase
MWIYQEIISETRPNLILETGTYMGGSALFMAHLLDILGSGEVITIDVDDKFPRPSHPRIRYVKGSSVDEALIENLLSGRTDETRLVVLDSLHTKQHVLDELNLLARYVSLGSYIIVEDTNVNGHPVYESFGEGPQEAVNEFLETNDNFIVDQSREKFLMTFNPRGYLKRIRL